MLLLRRMEFVQSVTWCEAAAVFARPATPLLLSHCINSRESTPKAWKRHTPLSLLQDPRMLGYMTRNKKTEREREKIQLRGNTLHCLFRLNFWCMYCIAVFTVYSISLQIKQCADTCVIIYWTINRLTVERKNVKRYSVYRMLIDRKKRRKSVCQKYKQGCA